MRVFLPFNVVRINEVVANGFAKNLIYLINHSIYTSKDIQFSNDNIRGCYNCSSTCSQFPKYTMWHIIPNSHARFLLLTTKYSMKKFY